MQGYLLCDQPVIGKYLQQIPAGGQALEADVDSTPGFLLIYRQAGCGNALSQ